MNISLTFDFIIIISCNIKNANDCLAHFLQYIFKRNKASYIQGDLKVALRLSEIRRSYSYVAPGKKLVILVCGIYVVPNLKVTCNSDFDSSEK